MPKIETQKSVEKYHNFVAHLHSQGERTSFAQIHFSCFATDFTV